MPSDDGEVIKRGKGRPPRVHEEWMNEKMIEVARNGGHRSQILLELGICKDTFYKWLHEDESFKEAYEHSKEISQAFWEALMLKGAMGMIQNFNFNAAAMIMNNKFPQEYRRSANAATTEINIGSINSIEKMDNKALDEKIERLQRKLSSIPTTIETPNDDSERED